ncbi:hypothetical protein RQP46_001291 [Phenoliferia psychrophenolica]
MAKKAVTRKSPSVPLPLPPNPASPPPTTATYSLRNKRPRPQSPTSPGPTPSAPLSRPPGLEDESDLSSLDDSDDNKPIDADDDNDDDDDEEAPQSEYEEDKKVVVKKPKAKVVVPKRKPGRPKKVVPAPAPAPESQPAQERKEPEPPAALPSPTSLHSPPVRNLDRRPTLQDGPFSHPPAPIQHPQMQHKDSPPTPLLQTALLGRLGDLINEFRIDAERADETLQNSSQAEVESSILRLPTRKHRSALCLTMNRYSAFCASPSVDVPAFPITSYKIALFLSRSSPSRAGRTLLHLLPQPHTKKTKWVRGGKSVDAPKIKPSGSPFDESLSPNLAHMSPPLSGPSTPPLSAAQPDSTWYHAPAAATQSQSSTGYSYAPPADPRRSSSSSVGYAMGGYDSQTFPRGPPPAQYYQPAPVPAPPQQLRTAPSPSLSATAVDQDHPQEHPHSHHSDDANEVDEFDGDGDGGKSASSQHTSGNEDSPTDKADVVDSHSHPEMPPPNSKPSPHLSSSSHPAYHHQHHHQTGPGGYPLQSAYHHPPPPSSQQQHAYQQQQGYWSPSTPHAQGYYTTNAPSYQPRSYAPQPTISYAQSSSSSYPHHQAYAPLSSSSSSSHYPPPSSSYQSSASSSSYPSSYVPQQRLGLDTNLPPLAGPGPGMNAYSPSTMYSPSNYQRGGEWGGYSYGSAAPAGGER